MESCVLNGSPAGMADEGSARPGVSLRGSGGFSAITHSLHPDSGAASRQSTSPPRDDVQAGECARYAARGGGTGGGFLRDRAGEKHEKKFARLHRGRKARRLPSSRKAIFSARGARFRGLFLFFPSPNRLP